MEDKRGYGEIVGFREMIERLEGVGIMRRISMNITTLFINLHLQ